MQFKKGSIFEYKQKKKKGLENIFKNIPIGELPQSIF